MHTYCPRFGEQRRPLPSMPQRSQPRACWLNGVRLPWRQPCLRTHVVDYFRRGKLRAFVNIFSGRRSSALLQRRMRLWSRPPSALLEYSFKRPMFWPICLPQIRAHRRTIVAQG